MTRDFRTKICILTLAVVALVSCGLLPAQTWIQLSPTGTPPPCCGAGVFDPATDRMAVLYANGDPTTISVLTNADGLGGAPQWIGIAASPDPVQGFPPYKGEIPSVVYDATSNRATAFGGCLSNCGSATNDVWVLTNANGLGGAPTWLKLFPAGGPPSPRASQSAVYDPATNGMIVFGGQNGCCFPPFTFGEVWILSNANGLGGSPIWTLLSTSGTPAPGQAAMSAVYDPASRQMTVFAGYPNRSSTTTNAVYVLSNANGVGGTPVWTNTVAEGAAGSPSERFDFGAVNDPGANRMTIFGGADDNGTDYNDVWVLNNANGVGTSAWTQLSPTGVPPAARLLSATVLNVASNRMIISGGADVSGTFNDTWVLTNANGLPSFNVCLLYDPTKAVKSGATDPIKLQLCDGGGNDLSASSITLHAVSVTQTSTSISGPVEDAGNANPDDDFRFDSTLGSTGGYIFNLKTTGLSHGSYTLNFTVTGESSVHAAPFQVM